MEIKPFYSGRMAYDITADNGEKYIFVPKEFAEKGFVFNGRQWYEPEFLKAGAFDKASTFTLPDTSAVSDQAKALYKDPSQGYIWKAEDFKPINSDDFTFQSYEITDKFPAIEGLSRVKNEYNDQLVYKVPTKEGWQQSYIWGQDNTGTLFRSTKVEQGRSLLGKVFGGVGDTLASAFNSGLDAINSLGPIPNLALAAISPTTAATIAAANAGRAAATGDFEKAALSGAAAYGLSQAGEGLLSSPSVVSPTGTTAGATTGAGAGGGLTAGGAGSGGLGLTATMGEGTTLFAPASGTGGLGLTAGSGATGLAAMGGAAGLTTAGAGGGTLSAAGLNSGVGALGGIGAGLGTSSAAMGTGSLLGAGAASSPEAAAAAGTAAGAAGMSELAKAGLIQGGLGLVGGLLQGNTTQKALEADAAARAALAEKTMQMGKFQPVGTTTRFGTSSFVTDPVTGAITPSYTLTPEAKAYQDALSAMGTQGLQAGQGLMNLGQQYVGESPEAVRQRYIATQNALLAPGNEQALAGIRNNLFQTGRTGLATGATSAGGLAATNPEMAAYYNSLANQQRQLAAAAETQYQNQVNFGTGLMGGATTPFTNVFTAQKGVEAAAQQPLELSTNFANTVATRGAAQGANYATAMAPSLQSSYNAANYNPYATALQGASSNPLVGYGLLKAVG